MFIDGMKPDEIRTFGEYVVKGTFIAMRDFETNYWRVSKITIMSNKAMEMRTIEPECDFQHIADALEVMID